MTIKLANKGSCIVVIDTHRYLKEELEKLADSNIYVELEDPSLAIAASSNVHTTNQDNVRQ